MGFVFHIRCPHCLKSIPLEAEGVGGGGGGGGGGGSDQIKKKVMRYQYAFKLYNVSVPRVSVSLFKDHKDFLDSQPIQGLEWYKKIEPGIEVEE